MSGGIGIVAIIGGLLLAAVLLFAKLSNSRRTDREVRRTEDATRDLYKQVDREDQVSDPDPKTN